MPSSQEMMTWRIERLETLDQPKETVSCIPLVERGVASVLSRKVVQFFETDECRVYPALADDVGGCGVVGDSIGPGAEGAPVVECGETAPERKVEFLKEVAALLGVEFVGGREPIQRPAKLDCCVAVKGILARCRRHGRLDSAHIKGSPRGQRILTGNWWDHAQMVHALAG